MHTCVRYRLIKAHRQAYELFKGEIARVRVSTGEIGGKVEYGGCFGIDCTCGSIAVGGLGQGTRYIHRYTAEVGIERGDYARGGAEDNLVIVRVALDLYREVLAPNLFAALDYP